MVRTELTNENAFAYHISKISKSWNLENPYNISLRDLLLEKTPTQLKNLRENQEFHFIAKVINDELNNKDVKNNCKRIKELIDNYLKNKKQKDGDDLLHFLFYVFLLKSLNKDSHFKRISREKTEKFLVEYKTHLSKFRNFHKVLSLYYLGKAENHEKEEIKDDVDLAVNILYKRLLLSNENTRDESLLIDYYLKQCELEKIDLTAESEITKGKLLELVVILKSASGKGLHIPEIEKEQYLSAFAKDIVRKKYLSILKDIGTIRLGKLNTSVWSMVFGFFLLESVIFLLPEFIESIKLGVLSINTKALVSLPIWSILIINGIIVALFLFIMTKNINRRLTQEEWK